MSIETAATLTGVDESELTNAIRSQRLDSFACHRGYVTREALGRFCIAHGKSMRWWNR